MSHYKKIKNKITEREFLPALIREWKEKGDTIVFTNGCFDIIHLGHIDYLSKAADFGTRFVIGVNTDASVSRLKGPHRPLQDQVARMHVLAAFGFVDAVVLFDEDTPLQLIQECQPDVLVKGADYELHQIIGADFVLAQGGRVERISYLDGYSTTRIEKKIKQG